VGIIPAGKFSIRVQLESTGGQDLDITLFDTTSTSEFSEGAAIVAWCSSPATCNAGVLGLEAVPDSATYKDMSIRYSGYNGQNGNRGSEWIEISGETTVDMMMRAFSYRPGQAVVTYSWGRSQTPCCLGQAKCGGSFTQQISQGAVVTVGEIPIGKGSVYIQLSSVEDVDIQVYDLDDTNEFSEGKAIVAWCPSQNCNKGVISSAGPVSRIYKEGYPDARTYTY
jgi:hypothetical protein